MRGLHTAVVAMAGMHKPSRSVSTYSPPPHPDKTPESYERWLKLAQKEAKGKTAEQLVWKTPEVGARCVSCKS